MTDDETDFIPLEAMGHRGFDVVLRGYERDQVDEYVNLLESQLQQARAAASRERPNYAELGQRVVRILELAEEEASSMRAAAQAAADAIREDALTATDRARAEAEQIRAAAAAEAENVTAQAAGEATQLVQRARTQAESIVADARADLTRLTEQRQAITAQLTSLREQLAALVTSSGPPGVDPVAGEAGDGSATVILRLGDLQPGGEG